MEVVDYKKRLRFISDVLIWSFFIEVLFVIISVLIPSIATIVFVLSVLLFAPAILGYFIAAGRLGKYMDKKIYILFQRMRGQKSIAANDVPRFFSILFLLLPIFFYISFGLTIELYNTEEYRDVLSSGSFYNLFIGLNSIFVVVMILKLIFTRKTDAPDFSPQVQTLAASLGFIEETEDGYRGMYKERMFYMEDFLEGIQIKTPNPYHRYVPLTLLDEQKLCAEVGADCCRRIFSHRDIIQDIDFDADWLRIILRNSQTDKMIEMLDLMHEILSNITFPGDNQSSANVQSEVRDS